MSECQPRTINQILPIEILATIFSFINPSVEDFYPHLPLSCVCHHWRSIILGNAKFWCILQYRDGFRFNYKEIVQLSKSHKLHVFIPSGEDFNRRYYHALRRVQDLERCIFSESTRITSLFIRGVNPLKLKFLNQLNSGLVFPQLESLSLGSLLSLRPFSSTIFHQSLVKLIATSRLRYLALPGDILSMLDTLKALHHLTSIEWLELKITFDQELNISRIFKILNTGMPNLQILYMSSTPRSPLPATMHDAVTFPRLRIMSLDVGYGEQLPPLHAPNLDYLCILNYPGGFNDWSLLEPIDFSQIKHIRIGFHTHTLNTMTHDLYDPSNPSARVACVSGMGNTSPIDCVSFKNIHEKGMTSRVIATSNDNSSLPPRNTFHIPIQWKIHLKDFFLPFKRATNLIELTLDHGSLKRETQYLPYLAQFLRNAKTITALNIMHARGFVDACHPLMDGHTAPRLERLTYHNAFLVKTTAFLPRHVQMLQDKRVEASSQPIKILELKNFVVIPDERVQEIQANGIQVVQL